jgi:tetratricopeptide (TPR) repeat protein
MRADLDVPTRAAARNELDSEHISRGERSAEQLLRNQVYHRLQAGELPAALSTAQEALALCAERLQRARSESDRDHALREHSLVLAALAEVNAELGWLEEARQYAEDALTTPHPRSRPRALRCLGVVHRRLHRLDTAEDCLSAAELAATEIADRSELIRILRDRALVWVAREDPDTAMRLIEQATELCDALGEAGRRRLPTVLWANGAVLMARNELALAEQTLVRADVICSDGASGVALWLPWIRHQRALVALADNQPSRSREFALRASEGFRDMHHRYGIAHCRLVIGRASLTEQGYPAAIPMLEEALQTFVGCGDRWAEADTRLPLAEALRHVGRLGEAHKALVQAAQDFDDLGDMKRRSLARARLAAVERDLRSPPEEGRLRAAITTAGNWLRDRDGAPLP